MNKILDKAEELRKKAKEILEKGKVVEMLQPFGKVILRGSYALDLMVVEDIDISVINPTADYKESAIQALNKFADDGYFQSCHLYNWSDYSKPEFPKGFYLGLQTPVKGKKWKIDIWFIKKETGYEKTIIPQLKNLSPEKRILILTLKQYKNDKKLNISSADIYKLVLEGKLNNIEELKNIYRIERF